MTGFLERQIIDRKAEQGFKRGTGPETGFEAGQSIPSATCPVLKTVTGSAVSL